MIHLKAWPDVFPALRSPKQAGLKLGFLSNFSREMLHANIRNASPKQRGRGTASATG